MVAETQNKKNLPTAAALTHVEEVLPKCLHPAVRVLAALRRQRVRDLLAAVLVADADVLDFALRVFLRRSYPGLLM